MAKQGRQVVGEDGLTVKQRKWLRVYIETGNGTEAAMQAYDCKDRDTAASMSSQNLQKLKGMLDEALEAAGITMELLFRTLREGLQAEVVEVAKHQGAICDEKSYADYPTRRGYLEVAAKLLGLYAPERRELSGPEGGPIQTLLTMEDVELDAIAGQ